MKTVGIWGHGVVGANTAMMFELLDKGLTNVIKYDKFKTGNWVTTKELINRSDFIFVCVPTPMQDGGAIDLDYVQAVLSEIDAELSCYQYNSKIIVIRSTVLPGSTDKFSKAFPLLNIISMPEFLVEREAWRSIVGACRIVIGVEDDETYEEIESLMRIVYSADRVKIIRMKRREAEMYKYACNAMLAMQVIAANEIYAICRTLGIDYNVIQSNFQFDKRIGTHTEVPGPDGDFGFGGKCFPKDTNALIYLSQLAGYNPLFLASALDMNERVRKERDWLDIPGAVSSCSFDDGSM